MIGVSKRCCPVCSCILTHLSKQNDTRPLRILGLHGTVYPCTLPPGLPSDIAEDVVDALESMLSNALFEVYRLDKKHNRTNSSRSHSSTDSHPFLHEHEHVFIHTDKTQLEYVYL